MTGSRGTMSWWRGSSSASAGDSSGGTEECREKTRGTRSSGPAALEREAGDFGAGRSGLHHARETYAGVWGDG